jgi:hypothetical protein
MQVKVYPADEVRPQRGPIAAILKRLNPGEAVNLPMEKRNSIRAAISRMHRRTACKYRTVKIDDLEIAIIREN